jgi:NAD(P)-dependent dehydrogenase (short-subunit alcohol dehydrogenase family)
MSKPVAIITGAGRGIGRATAVELAKRGYRLVLVSRHEAELKETAGLSDADALIAPADVADTRQLRGVAEKALAAFGRIDAIINNAGYAPVRKIDQVTDDEWQSILDVNLTAAIILTRAVWPTFVKQNAGVIVNLSSRASRNPFEGLGLYGAAKAALNVLGLALAREGEPHGIRVHTIAPGAVETGMFRAFMPKERVPVDKTLEPASVAKLIADCITGELAPTNGEVIWFGKSVS